jgi:hypothetical protein
MTKCIMEVIVFMLRFVMHGLSFREVLFQLYMLAFSHVVNDGTKYTYLILEYIMEFSTHQ